MSQAPLQISTATALSGLTLLAGVNAALAALASLQSGAAQPPLFSAASTALREGELWLDTGVGVHIVRLHDGSAFKVTFLANAAPDAVFLYANFGVL